MNQEFAYDKAATFFHKHGKDLAIDYEKIAVTNGKITLRKYVEEEITNASREFQNNMTLTNAKIKTNSRFADKMFMNCINLENVEIDDDELIDISGAFRNSKISSCIIPITIRNASFAFCNTNITTAEFSAPNLIEMKGMFQDCRDLTSVKLTDLNNVRSASYAFSNCENLSSIELEIPNATEVIGLFSGCTNLSDVHLKCKTKRCIDLFSRCMELLNLKLEFVNNIISTERMFKDSGLENYKVDFDTSYVKDMSGMFEGCRWLETIDLSNMKTTNAESMMSMFKNCHKLIKLDISSFDFTNIKNEVSLHDFIDGTEIKELIINKKWLSYTYYDARNKIGTIANVYEIPFYITDIETDENNYILELSDEPLVPDTEIIARGMRTFAGDKITTTWEEALQTATVEDDTITITSDVTGDITDVPYSNLIFSNCKLYNVHFKDMKIKTIKFINSSIDLIDVNESLFENLQELESLENFNLHLYYMNSPSFISTYNRIRYDLFTNSSNIKYLYGNNVLNVYKLNNSYQYLMFQLPQLEEIDKIEINKNNDSGDYMVIQTSNLKSINEIDIHVSEAVIRQMFTRTEKINKLTIYGDCERMFYNNRNIKSINEIYIGMENGLRANCTEMFARATNLERIGKLRILGDTRYMFNRCTSLKTIDSIEIDFRHSNKMIDEWYLNNMFEDCTSLEVTANNFIIDEERYPILIIYADYMFKNAPVNATSIISKIFNSINNSMRPSVYIRHACENTAVNQISDLILDKPTKIYADYLFMNNSNITDVRLSLKKAASVIGLFKGCNNLKTVSLIDIRNDIFDSISEMFMNCTSLETIEAVRINKDNIFQAANLFDGCINIKSYGSLDMSSFENLKDATAMYRNNIQLKKYIPLSSMLLQSSYTYYNTSIETIEDVYYPSTYSVSWMFAECKCLKSIKTFTAFDAEVKGLFENCISLESVGLFDIRTTTEEDSNDMFNGCDNLKYVRLSKQLRIATIDGKKILYHEWNNSIGANCKVFNQENDNMDIFIEMS